MPKAATELAVIEKTQSLLVWTLKHIEKFPRNHRYGIGMRLEERLTTILELLIEAKFTHDRKPLLIRCNLLLEHLRFQFRTVKDIQCLSIESYGSASRFVNEIGQNVGLWLRSLGRGHGETVRGTLVGSDKLPQSAGGREEGGPR